MSSIDQKIKELEAAQAQIAEQKARADALFLSIGDGVIATNEEGKISHINTAALELLGFERKELLGAWFPKAIVATNEAGQPIDYLERPIAQTVLTGSVINARSFYLRKDGSLLPVSITVSPIMLEDRPIGAIEVFRDITEELEIDNMKSDFISIASHQLRTPATAVKNYVGLLKEGYAGELTDEQSEFINMAYESNERQIEIVNDLLHVAQTESRSLRLNKQTVDLCELVQSIVREQLDTINAREQQLHYIAPKNTIDVAVDTSYFRMVIENLLTNASKYTPARGSIKVELRESPRAAVISVTDTGVGIAPNDMDRLFKKFTRIDNPLSVMVGGSGIGLYLLKQIVDLHDGKVVVKSVPKKGSTFTVTIPKQ